MATKKCPFCAEKIQKKAIKCKHCGEMLDQQTTTSPLPSPEPSSVEAPPPMPWHQKDWVTLLLLFLFFPLGVILMWKNEIYSFKFRVIVSVCFGLFLIAGAISDYQESVAQQQAAEQRQLEAEQRIEELRRAMPENYAQGMKLLKEKDYEGALAAFKNVAKVDANYENLPDLVKEANEALEAQKATEQEALEAQRAALEAEKAAERQAATNIPASSTVTSTLENSLKSQGVDVSSIQLADGRAKGGERILIIAYINRSGSENQLMVELTTVLAAGNAANTGLNAQIDSVIAVVGDSSDNMRATVAVNVQDTEIFFKTEDATAYVESWTVSLYDSSFMPAVAAGMGW